MVLISTGSTLMPCSSSQAIAFLISSRSPSSSSDTRPISSVTLAWRILVTTSNFYTKTQKTERLIPLAHPAGDGPVVPEVTGSIVVEEHGGTLAAFGAK